MEVNMAIGCKQRTRSLLSQSRPICGPHPPNSRGGWSFFFNLRCTTTTLYAWFWIPLWVILRQAPSNFRYFLQFQLYNPPATLWIFIFHSFEKFTSCWIPCFVCITKQLLSIGFMQLNVSFSHSVLIEIPMLKRTSCLVLLLISLAHTQFNSIKWIFRYKLLSSSQYE